MATEYHYLRADEIEIGDTLPDVSRSPVSRVIVDPRSHVTLRFSGTEFTRTARYGGEGYGYECFRVERSTPACPHDYVLDTGTFDADGSHITRCEPCGETWNEGVE